MPERDGSWPPWPQLTRGKRAASSPTSSNKEEGMAQHGSHELEQRRTELTLSLEGLSERRASTYRLNSDALALDRAGVKRQTPQELEQLNANETAAHTAVRDAQRELRDLDIEIASAPSGGFRSRFGRARRQG
jgi:hypothetical protein